MGFPGSMPAGLVDFIASTQNIARPSEFDRPVRSEALADTPDSTTRPRRAVVDLPSNGPSPESQQFDPMTILNQSSPQILGGPTLDKTNPYDQLDRSNLAGAVPTDLSGPPAAPPMTGPQISNADAGPTMGLAGAPSAATQRTGYANLPSQVQTPINQTWNGTVAPNINDDKYSSMGRGASAKAAFLQAMPHGGLVAGGINALIGVLDKGYGRQAQYNTDTQRWFNTKDAQLKAEEADPLIRSKIQEAQFEQEQPLRLQQYQAQQQAQYGTKSALQKEKYDYVENLQDSKDTEAMNRLKERLDSNESMKTQAQEAAMSKNLNATALAIAAANGRTEVTPADRGLAGKMIQDFDKSKTDKNIAQTDTAKATTDLRKSQTKATDSLAGLRDKQGNMVQDKIDNPDKYYKGPGGRDLTPNARYNAEMDTFNTGIKHIEKQMGQLEQGKNNGYPDPEYAAKKAQLTADRAKLITDKEARKKELLAAAPQPRGGGQNTGGLTPQQESDYQSRKAKHPDLTREDYLKVIQKLNK